MTWASTPQTIATYKDRFTHAEAEGKLVTVTLDGQEFHLIRDHRISYDFLLRVQGDPPASCFDTVRRALNILGIERDILPAWLSPASTQLGVGGVNDGEHDRYAVLAHKLGHKDSYAPQIDGGGDCSFECDDDAVARLEDVVLGPDVQQAHDLSPSAGDCGDHSVGDGAAVGTISADPTAAPQGMSDVLPTPTADPWGTPPATSEGHPIADRALTQLLDEMAAVGAGATDSRTYATYYREACRRGLVQDGGALVSDIEASL